MAPSPAGDGTGKGNWTSQSRVGRSTASVTADPLDGEHGVYGGQRLVLIDLIASRFAFLFPVPFAAPTRRLCAGAVLPLAAFPLEPLQRFLAALPMPVACAATEIWSAGAPTARGSSTCRLQWRLSRTLRWADTTLGGFRSKGQAFVNAQLPATYCRHLSVCLGSAVKVSDSSMICWGALSIAP